MIIILTQCFPSRIGGIENLMSNLALKLSDYEKVIVFADKHNISDDAIFDNYIKDKFLIRRIGGIKYFRRRKKIKELKSFLKNNNVKCIIGDTWKSFELCIDFLNSKKIPTICLVHGNEILKKDMGHFLKIQKILNKVNAVICNSNYTKSLISSFDLTKPIVKIIYPGASDYNKIKESTVYNICGNPILLTLARLEKRKGHENILYSVKELKNEFPNIQYVIAGSGKELINLKKLVKELKIQKNVLFVGNVNDFQKKYLLNKTNLMIMPTLDETSKKSIEGFGISYIEASFYGVPSIASDVGGTSEAVIHDKNI